MEKQAHTKEPWSITEKPLRIVGTPENDRRPVPEVAKLTSLDLANAGRIVACVNACKDIPGEWLKDGPERVWSKLIAQREALIDAVRTVANNIGEFAGAMQSQQHADVLTGYSDDLFAAISAADQE